SRLSSLISQARNDPMTLAGARLALSLALEMHGQYDDSLKAVASYESSEARSKLPLDLALKLRVQMSLASNYAGDHPKAIALLKAALNDLSQEERETSGGAIYAALARVYRSINEYP